VLADQGTDACRFRSDGIERIKARNLHIELHAGVFVEQRQRFLSGDIPVAVDRAGVTADPPEFALQQARNVDRGGRIGFHLCIRRAFRRRQCSHLSDRLVDIGVLVSSGFHGLGRLRSRRGLDALGFRCLGIVSRLLLFGGDPSGFFRLGLCRGACPLGIGDLGILGRFLLFSGKPGLFGGLGLRNGLGLFRGACAFGQQSGFLLFGGLRLFRAAATAARVLDCKVKGC